MPHLGEASLPSPRTISATHGNRMLHLRRCGLLDLLRNRNGLILALLALVPCAQATETLRESVTVTMGTRTVVARFYTTDVAAPAQPAHGRFEYQATGTLSGDSSFDYYIDDGFVQGYYIANAGVGGGGMNVTLGPNRSEVRLYYRPVGGSWELKGAVGYTKTAAPPPPSCKVTVALRNDRDVTTNYRLKQNGTVVGSIAVAPGAGVIQTFNVQCDIAVTVEEFIEGLSQDGEGNWVAVEGGVTVKSVGTVTPVSVPSGEPDPAPTTVPQSTEIPKTVSPTPAPVYRPVWKPRAPATDPANQTDLLTNTVFREGIEKLKEDTGKLAARDDALGKDDAGRLSSLQSAAQSTIDAQKSNMQTSATSEFESKVGSAPNLATSATGNIGATGSDGWPQVTIPLLGTVTFNPYNLPWLITILNGCREIILILLCVAFVRLQFERANAYELQVMTVNPPVTTQTAVENHLPALGQLLAWAKTAITALLVVQVAIAAYAAAVFLLDTQLGSIASTTWRAVTSSGAIVQSKLGSAAGNVFWTLAKEFFPLDAFLRLMLADVVCLFSMGKIFLVASSVVRAIRA